MVDHTVIHFEIPADDVEKISKFYGDLFGWRIQHVGWMDYWTVETVPTDDEGNPAPADVEFGFLDGQLRLFQLRPFLESKMARGIEYLHEMEARLATAEDVQVNMAGVPE